MKNIVIQLCTLFLILVTPLIFAQEITGKWYGNLTVQGNTLPLIIKIESDGNMYQSFLDSPMQGAKGIPIDKTVFQNNELHFQITALGISFTGLLIEGKINGFFSQSGLKIPLSLTRDETTVIPARPQEPKPPYPYDTTDITFKNEVQGNILGGTIAQPKDFIKNRPMLIMITGSGAQDRNEEMFNHKPFLVIADDLAKKDIGTFRMDDRGVGSSEKVSDDDTSADFATDINAAVNLLVKKGYSNIGLIGHSEGGMIAPLVALQNKNVKFLVLLAAPGIPLLDLTLIQNRKLVEEVPLPSEMIEEVLDIKEKTFIFAHDYTGTNFRADFSTYLDENFPKMTPQEKAPYIAQMASPWFRYFIKFNPDKYLSKVKIPVLAVNGNLDLQVSAKENLDGIRKSLLKAGNKNFKIKEFDGLNHLFQTAKTGNPAEYGQIEETFSPLVLDEISKFIKSLNLKKSKLK